MASENMWRTQGGRQLEVYCAKRRTSLTRFCEENALDRVAVQRAVKGERPKRISVDFALAIERATRGAVKVAAWASKDTKASRRRAAA